MLPLPAFWHFIYHQHNPSIRKFRISFENFMININEQTFWRISINSVNYFGFCKSSLDRFWICSPPEEEFVFISFMEIVFRNLARLRDMGVLRHFLWVISECCHIESSCRPTNLLKDKKFVERLGESCSISIQNMSTAKFWKVKVNVGCVFIVQ